MSTTTSLVFLLALSVAVRASSVTVYAPAAHTSWGEYDFRYIRWHCPSELESNVGSLELWHDNTSRAAVITPSVPCRNGSYTWIPQSHPTRDDYRIKFIFGASPAFSDQFTLYRPWAHFIHPTHTSRWPVASDQLVVWEYDGPVTDIQVHSFGLYLCEAAACEERREQVAIFGGLSVSNLTWAVPQLDVKHQYRLVLVYDRKEAFSQVFRLQANALLSFTLVSTNPAKPEIYTRVTAGQRVRLIVSVNAPITAKGPITVVLRSHAPKPVDYPLMTVEHTTFTYDFTVPALPQGNYSIVGANAVGLTGASPIFIAKDAAQHPFPAWAIALLGAVGGGLLVALVALLACAVWWKRRGKHLKMVEEISFGKLAETYDDPKWHK